MDISAKFGAIKLSYKNPGTEDTIEQSIVCNYNPSIELVNTPEYDTYNNENRSPTKVTCIQSSNVKTGVFKCTECSFTCSTTISFANHYEIHRNKDPYKCFKCSYEGVNKEDFLDHSVSHIESNFFKCSKCTFKTANLKLIKHHILKHESQNFSCSNCLKKFSTAEGKSEHAITCQGKQTFDDSSDEEMRDDVTTLLKLDSSVNGPSFKVPLTCATCYYIFSSRVNLTQHIYESHLKNWVYVTSSKKRKVSHREQQRYKNPYVNLERMFLCGLCYYAFENEVDYDQHKLAHQGLTACQICSEEFPSLSDLRSHRAIVHEFHAQIICEYCDEFLATNVDLIHHLKTNHNIRSAYPCPHCPRLLKTEQGLKQHLDCHSSSNMKSFDCDHCGYIAINPSDLRKHKLKHLEAVLECPQRCGKKFKTERMRERHAEVCNGGSDSSSESEKSDLDAISFVDDLNDKDFEEVPMRSEGVSPKEKLLVCSDCKESFVNASDLRSHLLTHLKSSPFRCQTCGLRCDSKKELEEHQTTHNGLSSKTCPVCFKDCVSASRLKRHLATHTDERPHQCEDCGSCYKTKDTLQKHFRSVHSNNTFKCTKCDFKSARRDVFKKHMANHERLD